MVKERFNIAGEDDENFTEENFNGNADNNFTEVDKDNEEAALAAATATKTHHSARKGSGARSPQVSTQGRSATDFCWAPKRRRRCLLRPEAKIRGQPDRA